MLQPNDDTLIQVEGASTHIICNGEEIVRTKIRDTLLRCLQKLWPKHLHTSCNLSFFHISATWPEPAFLNVSVRTFRWNTYFTNKKGTMCSLYAEGILFLMLTFWTFLMTILKLLVLLFIYATICNWMIIKKKSYDNRIFCLLNFFFLVLVYLGVLFVCLVCL